jgi:acetoin utilization deacetylase AcuC-like enzyme
MIVRIVYSDRHKLHATDAVQLEGRPFVTEEVPARAETILNALQEAQLGPVSMPVDYGLEPILAVHSADFVSFLQTVYGENMIVFREDAPVFTWTFATRHNGRKPKSLLGLMGYYAFGWGSPILEGTWQAAYWSAQCALSAAQRVRTGERVVYALCRPPGHHAAVDLYGGFCYLNNAAIAARYLQQEGVKVAVLDIDYHHGNGTQTIFYTDPAVLFCSLHAHPDDDFPYYWGEADERGEGPGEGYNRNWPLSQGTDDATYLTALDGALAVIHEFTPSYLVVSAGFDIVAGDPEGGFSVTTAGLREIGKLIAGLDLSTIIIQEGGYSLDRLGNDAVAFLEAFVDMN